MTAPLHPPEAHAGNEAEMKDIINLMYSLRRDLIKPCAPGTFTLELVKIIYHARIESDKATKCLYEPQLSVWKQWRAWIERAPNGKKKKGIKNHI